MGNDKFYGHIHWNIGAYIMQISMVFMGISISFKHQEYRCVYYEDLNEFFSIKNIGVHDGNLNGFSWKFFTGFEYHIVQIEMGFHGNGR